MKVISRTAQTPTLRASTPPPQTAESSPEETFVSSPDKKDSKLPMIGMGLATGAIGIGVPGALAIGAVKAFVGSHVLLGAGLSVAAAGVGALTVPITLMAAAMSTDGGDTTGFHSYLLGAGLSLGAAALAIF